MTTHDSATDLSDLGLRAPTVQELLVEIAHLQEALVHRDEIGQAKGIIRMLTRCDDERAFEMLRWISQDTNRKVRDIAVLIADCSATGEPLPPEVVAAWRLRTQ